MNLAASFRPRLRHAFGTAFACGPVLAAVTPLGLAPLFTLLTLVAVILYLRDHRAWPWPRLGVTVFGFAFIAWLALSALWTIALPETLRFLPRAMLYVIGGLALVVVAQSLPSEERRITDLCLVIGVTVGAALFAVEIVSSGAIASAIHQLAKGQIRVFEAGSLNRGAAVFAILAFPAALAARRRLGWPAAVAILAVVLSLTLSVQGHKAALGVVLGIVVFAASFAFGARVVPLVAAAVVLVVAMAPAQSAFLAAVPGPWASSSAPSVSHRLLIWRFVSERVVERPLLGWGLNSSRAIPGGKEGPMEGTEQLPLHPHSAPLQLWLELGAIGALLAAAGIGVGILALRRVFHSRAETGLAAAAVASAGLMSIVGYGLWQGWWISSLWLVAATIAAVAPAPETLPARTL